MSETLPSEQNRVQAWKRELPLHHELGGTLKLEETLALIGSFTQSNIESLKQDNEDGYLSDYDFKTQQQTHIAALEQLTTLELVEDDTARIAIAGRQRQIEAAIDAIGGDRRRHAESFELSEQLAAIKLLNKMCDNVEDSVDTIAQTVGDLKRTNPRNRASAINEIIKQHNTEVSSGSKTITYSPEIREAQERINARFAEQAKHPRSTETVDDARQKVAEAFGDTEEKERQTLISEVARAAKGATRIHTDRPNGVKLKSNSGDYVPRDGFTSFGDGLPQENQHGHGTMLKYGGSAEAFIFAPDTTTLYKTIQKTVETGGRFRKKIEQVEEQVADGEVPTMVVNPATGQQEPGVKVAYQFNGNDRRENNQTVYYEGPDYVTATSNRTGNQLFVEATLPKSVADRLKQEVSRNPEVAREFAKTLALNNGVTEEVWTNSVRPPYDQTPQGWKMTLADLRLNEYGHYETTSRQELGVQ